ncbi:hypothetical protein F5Y16DRAFT_365053 [Xylariaceae sp. FL0255]|nr:hypothetical protein F5Y16DRAFT_365053 [Xylariaceae sp. FL0255]
MKQKESSCRNCGDGPCADVGPKRVFPSKRTHPSDDRGKTGYMMSGLNIVSAIASLSSSLFAGSAAAFIGDLGPRTDTALTQRLQLPTVRQILCTSFLCQTNGDIVLSIPQATSIIHVFCLSTFILYRNTRNDKNRSVIAILVILTGIGFHLLSSITAELKALRWLPCLLSLGLVLSYALHRLSPLIANTSWKVKDRQ